MTMRYRQCRAGTMLRPAGWKIRVLRLRMWNWDAWIRQGRVIMEVEQVQWRLGRQEDQDTRKSHRIPVLRSQEVDQLQDQDIEEQNRPPTSTKANPQPQPTMVPPLLWAMATPTRTRTEQPQHQTHTEQTHPTTNECRVPASTTTVAHTTAPPQPPHPHHNAYIPQKRPTPHTRHPNSNNIPSSRDIGCTLPPSHLSLLHLLSRVMGSTGPEPLSRCKRGGNRRLIRTEMFDKSYV